MVRKTRNGLQTFDQMTPQMPTDVQRIEYAMQAASEIHFNTEGFSAPSSRAITDVEFGDPVRGYTNYEFGRVMQSYQDKTWFWRGSEPDYNANLQPYDYGTR